MNLGYTGASWAAIRVLHKAWSLLLATAWSLGIPCQQRSRKDIGPYYLDNPPFSRCQSLPIIGQMELEVGVGRYSCGRVQAGAAGSLGHIHRGLSFCPTSLLDAPPLLPCHHASDEACGSESHGQDPGMACSSAPAAVRCRSCRRGGGWLRGVG
jgi:hypothetical protein